VRTAPIDQIGKLVLDLIAIVLFVWLAWRLRHRPATPTYIRG
jgi:hypothetical protein